MSRSRLPMRSDEPRSWHVDEPPLERVGLGPRGLATPLLSAALVVAVIAGLIGLGLGVRLGQWSTPPQVARTPTLVEVVQPTDPPADDLRAPTVSARLRQAYLRLAGQTDRAAGWALCGLATDIECQPLTARMTMAPAWDHSLTFRNDEAVPSNRPAFSAGHLALVAPLGDGDITASLIVLDPAPSQQRSRALCPLDPDGSGTDYFDLGELGTGTYALVIGYLPQTQIAATNPIIQSYLTGFVVEG